MRVNSFLCALVARSFAFGAIAGNAKLRISEIMPKPSDDLEKNLNGRCGMDVNGLNSGWVELENISDEEVDLADYRFISVKRGKKTDIEGFGNFPSCKIGAGERFVFYTSDRYDNAKGNKDEAAFENGSFDGTPVLYGDELHNILVWGDKVNPKKFPFVRLYYAPNGEIEEVVDTVVIPSDIPEGYSIIVGKAKDDEGTRRWLCPTPTLGEENTDTSSLVRLGPNVGPLYENKKKKASKIASEFDKPTAPAKLGEDYEIELSVNAVMNPNGDFTPRQSDKIQSIKIVYRKDLDNSTLMTNVVDIASKSTDENWGDEYTTELSADYLPESGHLIQWKVLIIDNEGVEWTSPSFNNKDDGYEWYGTIVEPSEDQMSEELATWHMFATGNDLTQMDVDKDKQDLSLVPNYARIAIYDSSTSNYYDHVRIDLRGNTSAKFSKKGHGLRFAKSHPLTMKDCVSGKEIKEIRKTSLISEFADPSKMRQMIAFWLWNKMGNNAPFDFPVRCNLNGEFYQLAFNSERFTDELIEDVYKLDKFGYGYKNVGTLKSDSGTTAGSIEKKTPDDGNESDISVLESELRAKLKAYGADGVNEDNAKLTKFVVENFNLPAWLNYLASARITQEMDDVWANICIFYDKPMMIEGARGTGTWMPLGYDFNLSFGQYYLDGNIGRRGLIANYDWFKSHPFYGSNKVRCWEDESMKNTIREGNRAFEAVLQSSKFRRLYLRRLRTLMDQELKEPGVAESDVPFMVKIREMANLMSKDAELDDKKWPNDNTDSVIDVWPSDKRPENITKAIDEIWNDYVVPRREHLFITHSITNTAKEVGYGTGYNAGIPEAQSDIAKLKENIYAFCVWDEAIVIVNDNDEAVDMSGWSLTGAVKFDFPSGTVCDMNDIILVVKDRMAFIEAYDEYLSDEVIVGNASFNSSGEMALKASDGAIVFSKAVVEGENPYKNLTTNIVGIKNFWHWKLPKSAEVKVDNGVSSIVLNGRGVEENLSGITTNAIFASVYADIPSEAEGALIGFYTKSSERGFIVYAYIEDGKFTIYYDDENGKDKKYKQKTKDNNTSDIRDLTHAHLWSLAYKYDAGLEFYEDGERIAHDKSIKWTGDKPCYPSDVVTIGCATNGLYSLTGARLYCVHTEADYKKDNSIYEAASNEYSAVIADAPKVEDEVGEDIKAAIIENYLKYDIKDDEKGIVEANGKALSFADSAVALKVFGIEALKDGIEFGISTFDIDSGDITLATSPEMQNGRIHLYGKEKLDEEWELLKSYDIGEDIKISEEDKRNNRFFKIGSSL